MGAINGWGTFSTEAYKTAPRKGYWGFVVVLESVTHMAMWGNWFSSPSFR